MRVFDFVFIEDIAEFPLTGEEIRVDGYSYFYNKLYLSKFIKKY